MEAFILWALVSFMVTRAKPGGLDAMCQSRAFYLFLHLCIFPQQLTSALH